VAVQAEPRRRLPPEIFELPVQKLREGWYTDAYFNHTRATLLADGRRPRLVRLKVGRSFRPNPRLDRVE
jgi:hypothetical protein